MTGGGPPRRRLSYADVNYWPRVGGYFLFGILLVSLPGDDLRPVRLGFAALCLVLPQVTYWISKARGGTARTETLSALIDCFVGGLITAAFAFRLWPTTALYVNGVMNCMLFGGMRLLALGVMVNLLGLATAAATFGLQLHPQTESLPTVLSILSIFVYVILVCSTAYQLRRRHRETRRALEREERASQALLVNVFPQAVVPRLKAGEAPIADQFADVTVVFVDIVGFTPLAERLGPKRTVLLLNDLFARFDSAAARHGVEKIETTGDGYLAISGAPQAHDDHPAAVAGFALDVIEAASATIDADGEPVQVRVGVHTGPVFAGVIGQSRFHYKVFGETVNVASRVQSQARAGSVLVSETTFKRIRHKHRLEEYGTLELKGHGPMKTFWLQSP
jgi:class 3 adenylate cyclase